MADNRMSALAAEYVACLEDLFRCGDRHLEMVIVLTAEPGAPRSEERHCRNDLRTLVIRVPEGETVENLPPLNPRRPYRLIVGVDPDTV